MPTDVEGCVGSRTDGHGGERVDRQPGVCAGGNAAAEPDGRNFEIEFDPRLVEETVLVAADRSDRTVHLRFRAERDPLYAIPSQERREEAFREVHSRWFLALSLGTGVEALLHELPIVAAAARKCIVLRAGSPREEGADLHAPPVTAAEWGERRPILVIRLLPRTLLERSRLERMVRRELLHVADMLDPIFGYEPALPDLDGGPGRQNLVRDRYRILWETTVEGRLARSGLASPGVEARRHVLFASAFPMLGPDLDLQFRRFFSGARPSHAEIVAFAAEPPCRNGGAAVESRTGLCPLCSFPAARLLPAESNLGPEVLERIRKDAPGWDPSSGLCIQCADLYASSAVAGGPSQLT